MKGGLTVLANGAMVLFRTTAAVILLLSALVVYRCYSSRARRRRRQPPPQQQQQQNQSQYTKQTVLAFFHPYCSGGGGGERVLWKALQVLGDMVDEYPLQVVVYTIDAPSPHYQADLLQHVKERFSISISDKLKLSFVHLHEYKHLLKPSPRLSLLVESINSMRLAWHGLHLSQTQKQQLPHVFVDTMGAAFTFVPAALYFGCHVVAYVHYPTISTDMLQLVWQRRRAAYNHSADIAASRLKTLIKLVYYGMFAVLYGLVGSLAHVVMVNSTWTRNHIQSLWKGAAWRNVIRIVYPPCAVNDLQSAATISNQQQQQFQRQSSTILSIGQFRPEKDHVLQLEAVAKLIQQHPHLASTVKLVLIGSCRNDEDRARLKHLQGLAQDLGLLRGSSGTDQDHHQIVEFCVNQPYSTIRHWLSRAGVGLHTMWNEHFGIGIVEMMAAGLIVVAHNSGGPQSDIIVEPGRTGFLASTADEYAVAMYQALTMEVTQANEMRQAAQVSSQRFSDEVFMESFRETIVSAKIL